MKAQVTRPLKGLRVAPYYGCLISRPGLRTDEHDPEYPTSLDDLLACLGAEVVDFPLKTHCCGGHMTQISEGTGFELIRRLVKGAADYHADMIVTVCPMCQLNLDAFQGAMNRYFKTAYHVPVLYFTQMMGLAFGKTRQRWASARSWWTRGRRWPRSAWRCRRPRRPKARRNANVTTSRCRCRRCRSTEAAAGAGGEAMKPSDEARVGVYVCHCGSNIAGTVDVADVAKWAGEHLPNVDRRPRQQVHVLQPGPGADREGHQGAGADTRGGGRLLAAPARGHLPRRVPARGV